MTDLDVDDIYPFSESGGLLTVGANTYTYLPWTEDDSPLTLSSPLLADAEDGDPVLLSPLSLTKYATVVLGSDDELEPGDAIEATIQHSLVAMFPEGIRDDDQCETVTIVDGDDGYEVSDIIGRPVVFDGATIDPDTVPPHIPPAPSSSPDVATLGGLKLIFVKWDALVGDGPFTYELHVSTSTFTPVAGDPATLLVETPATMVAAKTLPDGTPFVYDTDYFFCLIAKTLGGVAPAGAVASGRMDQTASGDLAVGSVTADQLAAIVTFSTLFRTAETGQRGEWDTDSLRFYDSADNLVTRLSGDDSFFSGDATISSLETQAATLGGVTTGPPGGTFKVGSSIVTAPTLALDHVSVPLSRVATPFATATKYMTDTVSTDLWTFFTFGYTVDDRATFVNSTDGTSATMTWFSPFPFSTPLASRSTAISPTRFYAAGTSAGSLYVIRGVRATGIVPAESYANLGAAPGTGGYATNDPIIGLQAGTGYVLVAHRVQGAQTISGQSYANNEVMVRKYSPFATGTTLTMTLTQTIKTGLIANGPLGTVLMDDNSGTFDMPASAGNKALVLSAPAGFTAGFGEQHRAVAVANTGATVTASALPTSGAPTAWFGSTNERGLYYDGTALWGTEGTGDVVRKYGTSNVVASPVYHGYTYWNGTQETMLSPTVNKAIFARYKSQWTIPTLPTGITQVRLYESAVSTPRTRFERVGTYTGTAGSPLTILANPITPPAGSATNPPPASSNLTNGSSYQVFDDFGNTWQGGIVNLPGLATNESYQVSLPSTVNVAVTTNVTLTGLTQSVTSPGTTAVYDVSIDADVQVGVTATTNTIECLVDGTAETKQLLSGGVALWRGSASKTWRITGLSAGSHTFSFRSKNTTAQSVNISSHTAMVVKRTA
ncbi:hypothetical protein [Aeromicrobium sp. 9AM]|uniref:hypothetical protein n=1 Tax=Aeromicrobium sp. 9AM TaxID=2653126 RepID=UPI0013573BCF|nr:hypothetical protein [Aeromicrobium sp. 9AM]